VDDSPTLPSDVPPEPALLPPDHAFDPELGPFLPVYWWLFTSFGWVLLGLQIACVVHVIKTGRPYWWIWVIMAFPFVGLAAYVLVEVRPTWRATNWQALWWRLKTQQQRIAHRREQLEYAVTQKNRFLLAEELHNAGQLDEECAVLAAGLQGAFKDDAETLLRLSHAHLEAGRTAEAEKEYVRITPDRSSDFQARHKLMRARLWGAQGENNKAEAAFQELMKQRRSEAPRYYFAEFLLTTRRTQEARKILSDIVHQYRRGTTVWRYQEREWYYAAKRLLRRIAG
jgi:hypothetical protein